MYSNLTVLVLSLLLGIGHSRPNAECSVGEFESEMKSTVHQLISSMTLEEKVGQLTQINISQLYNITTSSFNKEKLDYFVNKKMVGTFLNNLADGTKLPPANPKQWVAAINELQQHYQDHTRLKIPMAFGLDSVHGANYIHGATILPQQLGIAATFNRNLTRKWGEITAKDTRAVGVHWNFSPILDIAVNKQWPRVYETFGEDPFLAAELGKEVVQGYQGESVCDLSQPDKVAATMKHFIGYSNSHTGHDVDGSFMSARTVNQYFRPSFQAAVDANIATAMESYSDIDGDHIVNSRQYIVDLLRNKMKFKGTLVTDWEQINKINFQHHNARSIKDAVYRVMKLGSVDVSMVPNNADFIDILVGLVREGRITEDIVNKNVERVLELKYKLGLLDGTDGKVEEDSDLVKSIGSSEDRLVSLEAARESVVMLKNKNNALPLKKSSKVFLTGPCADSLTYLTGGWTFAWQGTDDDSWFLNKGTTLKEGLKKFGSDKVSFGPSIDINGNWINNTNSETVLKQASQADTLVVCLGETHYTELVGNIDDMHLPQGQLDLVDSLSTLNKPIVLVLSQGRPRVFETIANKTSAILNAFLVGPEGGQAIADIIYGQVNPSGKLPVTYTNRANLNTLSHWRRYGDTFFAEWEFGYGLSYTTFTYSNLKLSSSILDPKESLEVSVQVTNSGALAGAESVLLFVSQDYRSISPEYQQLRGFDKIYLEPNESQTVTFTIDPREHLSFYNVDNRKALEFGGFKVRINSLIQPFNLTSSGRSWTDILEQEDVVLLD